MTIPRPIPRLLAAPVTSATMPFNTPMLLVVPSWVGGIGEFD
jgi:hypothetical protein